MRNRIIYATIAFSCLAILASHKGIGPFSERAHKVTAPLSEILYVENSEKLPQLKFNTNHENKEAYWRSYTNNVEIYGTNVEETGPRSFLNTSYKILRKAVKDSNDLQKLQDLYANPQNMQTIADHYKSLPEQLYFVEEATRVKMLDFLISNLEFNRGSLESPVSDTIQTIIQTNVVAIEDKAVAQSLAGDIIRLLAALEKYEPEMYQKTVRDLEHHSLNNKIIAYYQASKKENSMVDN
jgi:hypothetical protein